LVSPDVCTTVLYLLNRNLIFLPLICPHKQFEISAAKMNLNGKLSFASVLHLHEILAAPVTYRSIQ
jgi:hypothetical protein